MLEEQIKIRKELLKLYEKLEGNDKAKKIPIDVCKTQIKRLQDIKYCDYSSKSSYDNVHNLIGELSELIVKYKIANSLEEHINILSSWLKQIK